MSLFKARDWWSTSVGEAEEFGPGCLCVANIDNAQDGFGKYTFKPYFKAFMTEIMHQYWEITIFFRRCKLSQNQIFNTVSGKFCDENDNWFVTQLNDYNYTYIQYRVGPYKKIVVFTVACQIKIGKVGREFFFLIFFLLIVYIEQGS